MPWKESKSRDHQHLWAFGYEDKDMPDSAYPIRYNDIAKTQETDAKLQQKLVSHKDYTLDTFRGAIKTIL